MRVLWTGQQIGIPLKQEKLSVLLDNIYRKRKKKEKYDCSYFEILKEKKNSLASGGE